MKQNNRRENLSPLVAPDEHDRFFLIPRLIVFAGTAAWLALTYKQMQFILEERGRLIATVLPLLVWFIAYTVTFHLLARIYPRRKSVLYQISVLVDVLFITILIYFTGSMQSNFYLAYYPMIALEIFYFGLAGGALVTFFSSAAYLSLYILGKNQIFLGDFGIRLGVMFLFFFILAFLEENARKARSDIEQQKNQIDELNSRLEDRYQELNEDKEAMSEAVSEKEMLINSMNRVTERRRSQISFARELNAQNDIENAVRLFSRYVRGLLEVERADIVTIDSENETITLYPSEHEEDNFQLPPEHPLLMKINAESDDAGQFEATWNSDMAHTIPDSILLSPAQPDAMHIETLTGDRMGMKGILAVSTSGKYTFDHDLLDELKILISHLTVAIENITLRKRLQDLAETDGLTRIYNHRFFQESMERELTRAKRYSRPLSLVMFDIDHFKNLNDTMGHQTGDLVLRDLCSEVKRTLRTTDIFCRYGGEEFMIIMPETDRENGLKAAERIRNCVEKHAFRDINDKNFNITISVGLGTVPPSEEKAQLIKATDAALYRAKEGGRNRVESD